MRKEQKAYQLDWYEIFVSKLAYYWRLAQERVALETRCCQLLASLSAIRKERFDNGVQMRSDSSECHGLIGLRDSPI